MGVPPKHGIDSPADNVFVVLAPRDNGAWTKILLNQIIARIFFGSQHMNPEITSDPLIFYKSKSISFDKNNFILLYFFFKLHTVLLLYPMPVADISDMISELH